MPLRGAMLLQQLAGAILPRHCSICAVPAQAWLCDTCLADLDTLVEEPACMTCAAPLPYSAAPCPRCLGREGRIIATAVALGRHHGALRELVHLLKYNRRWPLAGMLARQLVRRPAVAALLASADYLVPVPLHWRRRLQRGYNHAELLAAELARQNHLPLCHALIRHRGTQQQAHLKSMSARARNVRGVFSASRHARRLKGAKVVLIDDVLTTQATLRAAARALRGVHPARIDAVVLAVADPAHRDFTTIVEMDP